MPGNGNNTKKDCLVLTVAISERKGKIETTWKDSVVAQGREGIAGYLHSENGVEASLQGIGADAFAEIATREIGSISVPEWVKKRAGSFSPKSVPDCSAEGVYGQIVFCDYGTGMGRVYAQSPVFMLLEDIEG